MELRVEGADLLHQPVDQLLRSADRQRGDVVDRLLGIELGTLTAGMCERIDQMRADSQQAELEHLEQAAGAGSDNDDLRFDGGGDVAWLKAMTTLWKRAGIIVRPAAEPCRA